MLRATLQQQLDEVDARYDIEAVVLAYGLCGAATAGLRAGSIPLVVPRAHDCITLFLGSRDRYTAEFTGHPGTYWYVQDFVERSDDEGQFAGMGAVSDAEARATHQEYVAKYGEDNAAYLMEALGGWRSHYDRAAYVEMAVADAQAAAAVEAFARDDASRRGWTFEKLAGQLILVRRLLENSSNDSFLRAGFVKHVPPATLLAPPEPPAVAATSPTGGTEPLTVVFDVAGKITLTSDVKISADDCRLTG